MASQAGIPTTLFGDQKVDVAPLATVSYARLEANEPGEVAKLLDAAKSSGFFYLDLQNGPAQQLLADVPELYTMSQQYFDKPQEVKMKDLIDHEYRGYKPGEHDETYEIARDEAAAKKLSLPTPFAEGQSLVERALWQSDSVVQTLLVRLSDALGLDGEDRFERRHRVDAPSNTSLKLIWEPMKSRLADVVENKHTDMGTLTLLFSDQWGLHVELPGAEGQLAAAGWAFVEPRPGTAVVNVADALQALSRDKLHSGLHRITQPADGYSRRYYVAYMFRPEITQET